MSTRTTDVNLIVRARTEGEKAVQALATIVQTLGGDATTASGGVAELGQSLSTLDKLFASISGKADVAAQAFDRQTTSLANAKAELRDIARQATEFQRNIDTVRQSIVSGVLNGQDMSGMRAALGDLTGNMERLDTRSAQLRRTIDNLEAGVATSRSSLQQLGSTVNAVEETQAAVRQRIDATTEALERQSTAARQNGAAMEAIRRTQYQDSGKSAELSAGVFGRAGLTETERKIVAGEQTANGLASTDAAHAQTLGLFGLKPYELQNLSYQINDVVTGLASGQHPMEVLAQQGGQLVQLFPRITSGIMAAFANPYFLGAAATIGTVVAGLIKAEKRADRLRTFDAAITMRTDAKGFSASGLSDQTRSLEEMGAKAKDAETAVKTFLNDGVNPEKLSQFARAALDTSRVLGVDLPTAAQQMAEAFTGGFEAIAKLDDKLNFLTATERAHIQELFNEGNANAARTEALNAYTRQGDAAAAKQRGPWGEAARSLGLAWKGLMDWISESAPIKAAIFVLNELAGAVKSVGDAVADATGHDVPKSVGAARTQQMVDLQGQIVTLQKEIDGYNATIAKGSPIAGTLQALVTQSQAQLDRAKAQLATLEKKASDTANDDPNGPKAKQRTERLADIDLEQQIATLRRNGQDDGLNARDSKRRETLAGELAYRQEMKATGDAIVAGRLRERAVAEETLKVDKENDDARKRAKAEREREIGNFERRVIGAEGGAGKNPHSTAAGYGQFTEGTWLSQFRKTFPDLSDQMSRDQVLALRGNERTARGVIDAYARENAKFLESFGAKVSAGNLYLAHFLGAGGAKAVLTADGATPVDQIIRRLKNSDQILSGNQQYLRTEDGKGRYRTASELETFIAGRVTDTGSPRTEALADLNKLIEDAANRQKEFNEAVEHGNEDRARALDGATKEFGLADAALIAEQRRQAVAQAVLDLKQKAEDANKRLKPGETLVEVSPEQIAEVERLTGALFDAQHAAESLKAALDTKERPLNDLQQQQQILQQQADFLRSIGDNEGANKLDAQVAAISAKIQAATEALVAFYQSLTPEQLVALGIRSREELDALIAKLRIGAQQTQQWGKIAGVSAKDIAQAFASSAAQSFTNFINKVAGGKNVFKALGESVREFAANFIGAIAQIIIQLLALQAVVLIMKALGVPVPSSFGVGQHHSGGLAGASGGGLRRTVSPAVFAAAVRYHSGGIAGFAPDEVPAILQRNEEVLTTSDPRHRANGGLTSGVREQAPAPVHIINTFDREEAAEMLLRTRAGGRMILNIISDNKMAVKAALT